MGKSIQELAREYAAGYLSKAEQDAAFGAYCTGYKKAMEDKAQRDNLDVSFAAPAFQPILTEWFIYKKERKESYKGEKSMKSCYKKLRELSDGNAEIAKLICEQSMANNWAGLYELKNYGNKPFGNKQENNNTGSIFEIADRILQEYQ